jgi:hypothetical protein
LIRGFNCEVRSYAVKVCNAVLAWPTHRGTAGCTHLKPFPGLPQALQEAIEQRFFR